MAFSDTKVVILVVSSLKSFLKKIIVLLLQSQNDSVAQLVEQLTLNQWVEGSSPSGVTSNQPLTECVGGFFISFSHYSSTFYMGCVTIVSRK